MKKLIKVITKVQRIITQAIPSERPIYAERKVDPSFWQDRGWNACRDHMIKNLKKNGFNI